MQCGGRLLFKIEVRLHIVKWVIKKGGAIEHLLGNCKKNINYTYLFALSAIFSTKRSFFTLCLCGATEQTHHTSFTFAFSLKKKRNNVCIFVIWQFYLFFFMRCRWWLF
jgi:hypothetical protein